MLPREEEGMIHMTTSGKIRACLLGYRLVWTETQIQYSNVICVEIRPLSDHFV